MIAHPLHIRNHELYLEAGYQNIWDYARERFGFSRSTASRYMSRNDRFCKDGNSPVLDDRYSGYKKIIALIRDEYGTARV